MFFRRADEININHFRIFTKETTIDRLYFLFSAAFRGLFAIGLLYLAFPFDFTSFYDRAIGPCVFAGYPDPTKRSTFYFLAIAIFSLVFICTCLQYPQKRDRVQAGLPANKIGKMFLMCISVYLGLCIVSDNHSIIIKIISLLILYILPQLSYDFDVIRQIARSVTFTPTSELEEFKKKHKDFHAVLRNGFLSVKNFISPRGVNKTLIYICILSSILLYASINIFLLFIISYLGHLSQRFIFSKFSFPHLQSQTSLHRIVYIVCIFIGIIFFFNALSSDTRVSLLTFHRSTSLLLLYFLILGAGYLARVKMLWPAVMLICPIALSPMLFFFINITLIICGIDCTNRTLCICIFISEFILIFLLSVKKKYIYKKYFCNSFLRKLYFPLLLIIISFNALYKAAPIEIGTDLLHSGNYIVPIQQLFKYNLLPYVDFWPGQGIQKCFFAVIAGILHLAPTDIHNLNDSFLANFPQLYYSFLPICLISIVAFYWCIEKYTVYIFAFFISLAFFGEFYYGLVLLSVLMTYNAVKSFSYKALFYSWIIALFIFVMMPSAGKPAILLTFFSLCIYAVPSVDKCKKLIITFIVTFSITFLIYCILLVAHGKSITDTINLIFVYAGADPLVGSYPTIFNSINFQVILQYLLLPILCACIIIYTIYLRFTKQPVRKTVWLAVILAICHLSLSLRTLNRHCLVEGYAPYFSAVFPFIFSVLPVCSGKYKKSIILFLFIPLLFYSTSNSLSVYEKIDSNYRNFSQLFYLKHINLISAISESYTFNTPQSCPNLVKYLKDELNTNETFLEFINSHLLFFLTNKKDTLFHSASQIIYPDTAQKIYIKHIDNLRKAAVIPLILTDGPVWQAKIDNLPELMKCFRISEYIYNHYIPHKNFDGFVLWAEKNSRFAFSPTIENSINHIEQHFPLGHTPYLWANFDTYHAEANPVLKTLGRDISLQHKPIQYSLDNEIIESSNYVLLRIQARQEGTLSATIASSFGKGTFTFSLLASDNPVAYLVRISSLYAWHGRNRILTFSSDIPIDIQCIDILHGD